MRTTQASVKLTGPNWRQFKATHAQLIAGAFLLTTSFAYASIIGLCAGWIWHFAARTISLALTGATVSGSMGGLLGMFILSGLTTIEAHPFAPLLKRDIALITFAAASAGISTSAICGMLAAGLTQARHIFMPQYRAQPHEITDNQDAPTRHP
jgi:hypothetical protein